MNVRPKGLIALMAHSGAADDRQLSRREMAISAPPLTPCIEDHMLSFKIVQRSSEPDTRSCVRVTRSGGEPAGGKELRWDFPANYDSDGE